MPFSMTTINPFQRKKDVTLQVRILHKPKQNQNHIENGHGRKAFLSASASASMTLEAALVLPLFLFAAVLLMLPMKIMNTERKIQAGLEAVGEDFSRYAYVKDVLEKGDGFAVVGAGDFARQFCGFLTAGAAEGYAQVKMMERMDTDAVRNVRMLRSSILEDGEIFDLLLDYEIRMPFPVLGMTAISRTARCRRRAWIGRAGMGDGSEGEGGSDSDQIVYIGKNSTRYHRDRGCHYLANNLTGVSYGQIPGLRNKSGGKYSPCSVCARKVSGGTVYIMPEGSSFHTRQNCTAIIAYVKAVRLSEVEYLGPCSYCSG